MGNCKDCWYWEYRQSDDANERYGQCRMAYAGTDEAYPRSDMLLDIGGPEHAKRYCYPVLLTHENFGCKRFEGKP